MAAEHVERIGRRIRERREELGLSQLALARQLTGSIGSDQVSRWERGLHRPHDDTLDELGRVLGVDPAYFMSDGPSVSAIPVADESQLDRIEAMLGEVLDLLRPSAPDEVLEEEADRLDEKRKRSDGESGRTRRKGSSS